MCKKYTHLRRIPRTQEPQPLPPPRETKRRNVILWGRKPSIRSKQATGYRDTATRGAKLLESTTTRGADKRHGVHNSRGTNECRKSTTFRDANGHRIPPASPKGLPTIHGANCTDGTTSAVPGAAIAAAAPGTPLPRGLPWSNHPLDRSIRPRSSNTPVKLLWKWEIPILDSYRLCAQPLSRDL